MGARPNNFISQTDFYESSTCKYCGDDTRRVVCSDACQDHTFCAKGRGVCFECGLEKLGGFVTPPPVMSLLDYALDPDREGASFENAVRLLEDGG